MKEFYREIWSLDGAKWAELGLDLLTSTVLQ